MLRKKFIIEGVVPDARRTPGQSNEPEIVKKRILTIAMLTWNQAMPAFHSRLQKAR